MSNDNEVELSPGFFDLNNPMNDEDLAEISSIIPEKINVENADDNNTKNFAIEFITLMILNTSSKPCGCEGGWARTKTY
jgi:hypothetical protein